MDKYQRSSRVGHACEIETSLAQSALQDRDKMAAKASESAEPGATGPAAVLVASSATATTSQRHEAAGVGVGSTRNRGASVPIEQRPNGAVPANQYLAKVRFRVFPADCAVSIDERRQVVQHSGRYELQLSPGRHRIVVQEPVSGKRMEHSITLRPGEQKTIPGGFRMVTGLP